MPLNNQNQMPLNTFSMINDQNQMPYYSFNQSHMPNNHYNQSTAYSNQSHMPYNSFNQHQMSFNHYNSPVPYTSSQQNQIPSMPQNSTWNQYQSFHTPEVNVWPHDQGNSRPQLTTDYNKSTATPSSIDECSRSVQKNNQVLQNFSF